MTNWGELLYKEKDGAIFTQGYRTCGSPSLGRSNSAGWFDQSGVARLRTKLLANDEFGLAHFPR
jgi:hypothetical protein